VAVGADPGSPALPDYKPPFAYGGRIRRALVDVSGTPLEDLREQMRQILARQ
jgi:arylsulfatase